jgi:DNA-binding FadR family transcriptional regulator
MPPSPRFKAVTRRPLLYQAIQEEIKAFIIENALKPGDPLPPETELAAQLAISRNSVREAVKSLVALGILESRPGAGLFVSRFSFDPILNNLAYGLQFDVKQLADILEVRHYIEHGTAAKVTAAVTPEQMTLLRQILERMLRAAQQGQYFADTDEEFHRVLYQNVDNAVLLKILDIFWAIYKQAQDRVSMPQPVDPLATYQRHVVIAQALEARDTDALLRALDEHRHGVDARVRILEQAQKQHAALEQP